MNLPGFTGEVSLGKPTRSYQGKYRYGHLATPGTVADVTPNQLDETSLNDLAQADFASQAGDEAAEFEPAEGPGDGAELEAVGNGDESEAFGDEDESEAVENGDQADDESE